MGEQTTGTITATLDDQEVGGLVFTDYCRRVRINTVVVAPEQRKQGIGRAMVAELRERLPRSRLAASVLNRDGKAFMDAIYDEFAEPLS